MHNLYFNTYTNPLWCSAQAKFPGVNQAIPSQIMSDTIPICGQTQRSSMNFQVGGTSNGNNSWIISVAPGISFDIMQDIGGGTDKVVATGVSGTNSTVRLNPSNSYGVFNYYIANPKGATSAFYVNLTTDLSNPPPPLPPQQ